MTFVSVTSRGTADWCGDNRITKRRREGKVGEESMKGLQMRCLISIAGKRERKKWIMERPWNQSYEWRSGQKYIRFFCVGLVYVYCGLLNKKGCTARYRVSVSLQLSCEFSVGGMDAFGRSALRSAATAKNLKIMPETVLATTTASSSRGRTRMAVLSKTYFACWKFLPRAICVQTRLYSVSKSGKSRSETLNWPATI